MTAVREAENRTDMNELTGRRNNISLQDAVTITAAVKEAGEEEDVIMKVMLLWLIDIITFTFNLAFLAVTEAAAALQRCLLTRKHQNKSSTVLQE
ncbi:uncharacterized protein BDCG_16897 [Blastomyces dermatitidis ER-3]|uniref:Uncharacterized protein n=1 Tax=Ajellomyces dermatitidis (strain ER-3 / ATCC MYA-2586) TaxID=559297 RepID=A0ABP2F0F7_AJEDR|nr:uncharacterized protein BDCG_16897 [Blastomyces dermatitidis ER-3]EEQ89140.2 hypothetical protein BDCG_16897 [Blastomyces dermatitidis ER-3]